MKTIVFVNPLKTGKINEYQAFIAENIGPRKQEYSDLFHRYGLKNVKIYHHKLGGRECIIVIHDAEDHAMERLAHFSSSTNSYDRWFCEQLEKLHDLEEETNAQFLAEFAIQDQNELSKARETQIRNLFHETEKLNYQGVVNCFAPQGKVASPVYGTMEAKLFFNKLFEDVKTVSFTVKNLFTDETNPDLVAAYITSSWKFKGGNSVSLEGVNIFEFSPKEAYIQSVKFIYDTHLFRQELESIKASPRR